MKKKGRTKMGVLSVKEKGKYDKGRGRDNKGRVRRKKKRWMRSSRVVRASDCQCQSRISPGFDHSII